jgi:plasmid stabilization system protein ParE
MTAKQALFHPAAIEEAEAAARWYCERSPRAAARFVDEIYQVIDKIVDAPQRWALGPQGTRKVKLPCFPFLIIYRESNDAIQILAVAHGRRRPNYWKTRR